MTDYREALIAEWRQRAERRQPSAIFPLIGESFDHREIAAAVDVLLTGRLTMGDKVREFETEFARRVGAPYAVMVNSGSSANLLAVTAATLPDRTHGLGAGDEVLVPAVCWATSVWPLLQHGLRPIFVDVDPGTLNADVDDFIRRVTPRTRAAFAVHVLGNSAPMADLLAFAERRGMMVLEDACESLGATSCGRWLGTLGEFGTFSFYFSHHITTGEGGMVVCQTLQDVDRLRSLRSHGWSRDLSNRCEVEQTFPAVDPRFLFVNTGYNVRPLELQGAIGLCQLARLASMNETRCTNRDRLIRALVAHPAWDGRLDFPRAGAGTTASWFGFACLLSREFPLTKRKFLAHLSRSGVENRPIISGNFTRQPALRAHGIVCDPRSFPGAEIVDQRGFFIGIHTEPLSDDTIGQLADILLAPVDVVEGVPLTQAGQ